MNKAIELAMYLFFSVCIIGFVVTAYIAHNTEAPVLNAIDEVELILAEADLITAKAFMVQSVAYAKSLECE